MNTAMDEGLPELTPIPGCESEWTDYVAEPSPITLGALLQTVPVVAREQLIEAIERACQARFHWKIAQHLCLLHQDTFAPRCGRVDLVRALYFSHLARKAMPEEPSVILASGRLHWERRLPLAVLYDAGVARKLLLTQSDGIGPAERRLLGECARLLGVANAYLGRCDVALAEFREAERALNGIDLEDMVQLHIAGRLDHPEAAHWSAMRLARVHHHLGGRHRASVEMSIREALARVLRRRTESEASS